MSVIEKMRDHWKVTACAVGVVVTQSACSTPEQTGAAINIGGALINAAINGADGRTPSGRPIYNNGVPIPTNQNSLEACNASGGRTILVNGAYRCRSL